MKPDDPSRQPSIPPGKAAGQAAQSLTVWTVEHQLYQPEGICSFEFFQAIRLLTLLNLKDRQLVGEDGPPHKEIVRFQAHLSLAFPASAIQKLVRDTEVGQPPKMTINFLGLTGPNGVLPRPYTERLWADMKGAEKTALQDWLDLFNHRIVSLFYRAWEKYHFFLPFERGSAGQRDPDAFSRSLFSLIGLGFRSHRNRFRVVGVSPSVKNGDQEQPAREKELARLDDLSLLRFGGLFSHRPRCAVSLEIFLQVTLGLPVKVHQFQGQWLQLNRDSQTTVGTINSRMGQDILVGDRVWDVQSKVRIQIGPLKYDAFQELLPDRNPEGPRKKIFLLAQLVQFYLGAELDVEFQLLLKQDDVPATKTGFRTRLGWDSWSRTKSYPNHANDTVFTVSDRPRLN